MSSSTKLQPATHSTRIARNFKEIGVDLETTIHLIIPSENSSSIEIISALRLFESLIALRALSPANKPNSTLISRLHDFHINYNLRQARKFLREFGYQSGDMPSLSYVRHRSEDSPLSLNVFEDWIQSNLRRNNLALLPLEEISIGSYEFVFHTASLFAIFGLQEYALLKDIAQWVFATFSNILPVDNSKPVILGDAHLPRLRINSAVLNGLREFDEVELEEEVTQHSRRLKIRLIKHRQSS